MRVDVPLGIRVVVMGCRYRSDRPWVFEREKYTNEEATKEKEEQRKGERIKRRKKGGDS